MTNFDSDLINSLDPDKLYYLASPYSHPLESVRYDRFKQISIIAGDLLFKHGIKCITPICSSRPIAHFVQKEGDWETWQELDKMLIDHSDGVLVAQMNGWQRSVGVTAEIDYAKSKNIPVYMLKLNDNVKERT